MVIWVEEWQVLATLGRDRVAILNNGKSGKGKLKWEGMNCGKHCLVGKEKEGKEKEGKEKEGKEKEGKEKEGKEKEGKEKEGKGKKREGKSFTEVWQGVWRREKKGMEECTQAGDLKTKIGMRS